MAQAQSAQREPSMEEILASIRRIIEDGDTARPETVAEAAPVRPATVEPSAGAARETRRIDREAPQAALRPASPAREARLADDARPRNLDPVRQFPADAWRPEPDTTEAKPAPAATVLDRPIEDAAPRAPESQRRIPAEPAVAAMEAKPATPPSLASEPVTRPVAETAAASREAMPSFQPARVESTEPARPAIVSPQAGRQVAAAFGELSEAFEASRRRTFDEIATEMMRPMLQDWLDNNLPRLVEKLVREEIERIARGSVE